MRNSMLRALALVADLCALPVAACAAASGSYICAIGEVYECEAVNGCKRVSTDTINLSAVNDPFSSEMVAFQVSLPCLP